MKRIYIILLLLCPLWLPVQVSAQLYSTAEAALRASRYQSGPTVFSAPPTTSFRSTSTYTTSTPSVAPSFATTTIRFANGSIQTAASTLGGGVLADDSDYISTGEGTNSSTTYDWNDDEDGWGTGTPDLPLSLDWDAILLLLTLAILYAFRGKAASGIRILKKMQ